MNLIIGVGNTLRNDDGIGAYIVGQIDAIQWPGVATQITQQLHLEVLEDFLAYEKIIIVDASYKAGADYDLQKVNISQTPVLSSSHHVSLQLLCMLAKNIYQHDINLFLCAIKGRNFEIGEILSAEVLACVPNILELISREIGDH